MQVYLLKTYGPGMQQHHDFYQLERPRVCTDCVRLFFPQLVDTEAHFNSTTYKIRKYNEAIKEEFLTAANPTGTFLIIFLINALR